MRLSVVALAGAAFLAVSTIASADDNGALTGAAGGAVTGAVVGGPVGAAVGGLVRSWVALQRALLDPWWWNLHNLVRQERQP